MILKTLRQWLVSEVIEVIAALNRGHREGSIYARHACNCLNALYGTNNLIYLGSYFVSLGLAEKSHGVGSVVVTSCEVPPLKFSVYLPTNFHPMNQGV
jgi:hypothetical protein